MAQFPASNVNINMQEPTPAHDPESSSPEVLVSTEGDDDDVSGNNARGKNVWQQLADGDVTFEDVISNFPAEYPPLPPPGTPEYAKYHQQREIIVNYLHSTEFFDSIFNHPDYETILKPEMERMRTDEKLRNEHLRKIRYRPDPERTRRMQEAVRNYWKEREERERKNEAGEGWQT